MRRTHELFRRAFGPYVPHTIAIVLLAALGSAMEGLGISAIVPAFSFAGGQAGTAADAISQIIQHLFSFIGLPYSFRFLLFFMGVLFVLRTVLVLVIQYVTARIVYGYERDLRTTLFGNMVRAGWPFLSQQKVGQLDQLLITNTTNTSQFFNFISTLALIGTKAIAYIIIAINLAPTVAVASLLAGLVAFVGLRPLFSAAKAASVRVERLNRGMAHFVSQHVGGMKTIKAAAVEEPVERTIGEFFESIRSLFVRMMVLRGTTETLVRLFGLGFVGIVFVVMYQTPGFNIAAFAVIVYVINQIFSQVQAMQVQMHALSTMVPYIGSVFAQVDDARANREETGGGPMPTQWETLAFDHVSFTYPGRERTLEDASFEIKRGGIVGIIGPSGAGKTTLVDLLMRLFDPHKGEIVLDGVAARTVSRTAWRTQVGYVAQDSFLLNDTIARNIAFYHACSHEEIVAAAKAASVHEFIESLPQGYETVIGDRGVLVSGGQRQRIALARALVRMPELLILDEATSSLDSETEAAVHEAIDTLRGKTTIIIIAHRLSTVASADELLVVEKGRITERGTPEELFTSVGLTQ